MEDAETALRLGAGIEKIVVLDGFGIAIVINHEVVICLDAIFADVSLVSAIARKVFNYLLPD